MQKQIWTIALAIVGLFHAQTLPAQSFEKGKTFVSLGYGLFHLGTLHKKEIVEGGIVDIRMDNYAVLPLALQLEYGLAENLSLGLSAYYERYAYKYSFIPLFGTERFNQTEDIELISAIARSNYHLSIKQSRWDPYFGFGLGITRLLNNADNWPWDKDYHLTGELRVGGRYFFSENIGAHLEIGLGTIFVQTGLTVKF
jgi:outer membrane protein W